VRSTKEKDTAQSRDHISARRQWDVAEERSILTMHELEHLSHCDLCVDHFVELVRLSVESRHEKQLRRASGI